MVHELGIEKFAPQEVKKSGCRCATARWRSTMRHRGHPLAFKLIFGLRKAADMRRELKKEGRSRIRGMAEELGIPNKGRIRHS